MANNDDIRKGLERMVANQKAVQSAAKAESEAIKREKERQDAAARQPKR